MIRPSTVSRGALALGLIFGSGSAFGQTSPATVPAGPVAEPASPPVPQDAENPQGDMLADIIVTAQKRSQSLKDVPVSISVVQGETLRERGIKQLSDLPAVVPSFEFVRAPNNIPGLTFRGLGPQSGNVAFDSSIGMFVDGVFLGNIRLYNQTIFDVQRAEFIKGTQSSLLGKNSTVGALSIVNATPSDRFEGRIEGGGEVQDGGYFGDGAINIPLSDTLAMRVSGRYSHQKGYIKNITTGLDGPVGTDWGGRIQLAYDGRNGFKARIAYQHTDNKLIGSANQCVAPGFLIPGLPGAPFAPVTSINAVCGDGVENDIRASFSSDPRLSNGDDYLRDRSDMVHGTIDYDFGPATLTSITAGVWSKTRNAFDFDFDNKDLNLWIRNERYSQITQELRLTSNDTKAPIQYIIGGFFIHSKFHTDEDHIWKIPDFLPRAPGCVTNLATGTFCPGDLFNGSYNNQFDQTDDTYSIFAQLNFKPTDRFTINLGGRYSHDRKIVNFGHTPDFTNLTVWNTAIQAPFPYQRLDPAIDNLLSGSIALQYQFDKNVTAYASASRGGKAGEYGEFASVSADLTLPFLAVCRRAIRTEMPGSNPSAPMPTRSVSNRIFSIVT